MSNQSPRMNCLLIAVLLGLMPGGASQAAARPLKVFILAGQSNMQGHANVSTFDSMADDPKTAPILKELRHADGTPRVCRDVWISSIGCAGDDTTEQTGQLTVGFGASTAEIGPELTFGIYLEKRLGGPILIIKTAWGGKDLHTDFRPPSAGPFVWSDFEFHARQNRGDDMEKDKAEKIKATGVYYRLMIEQVRRVLADIPRVDPQYDPKEGYELDGFVWFQGFNDLVSTWTYDRGAQPGGYDLYGQFLADFIRDVRKDLAAPKLPFVIGIMGIDGVQADPSQLNFRQAEAAPASLPEFNGTVAAVPTASYWDSELGTLRARLEANWPKVDARVVEEAGKNPKMTSEELSAFKTKITDEAFTPEERKRLLGASNGGYHYLGAAKILAQIGKAFAEAMADLQTTQPQAKH